MIPTRRNGLTTFQPWNDLFSLRREMTDLLENLTPTPGNGSLMWAPPVSVREDAENVYVEVELPGVDPESVDIAMEDRVLTISGEKRAEQRDEQDSWHLIERRFGRFERSFTMGRAVDANQVEASYDLGVLTIRLPKPEEAKPRRIRISAHHAEGREIGAAQS